MGKRPQTSVRYALIDLLRVVAVAVLILGHLTRHFKGPLSDFTVHLPPLYSANIEQLAVTLFLVLSGLTLSLVYRPNVPRLHTFLGQRFRRIYGTYLLALPIGALLITTGGALERAVTVPDVVCSLVGFCAFFNLWGGPFIETGWFIGTIVCLYFLFPSLHSAVRRHPWETLIATFLFSFVWKAVLILLPNLPGSALEWHPFSRLFEFTVGIALGVLCNPSSWAILNRWRGGLQFLSFAGTLTFPLFLLHFPLLQVFPFPPKGSPAFSLSLVTYCAAAIALSVVVLALQMSFRKQFKNP